MRQRAGDLLRRLGGDLATVLGLVTRGATCRRHGASSPRARSRPPSASAIGPWSRRPRAPRRQLQYPGVFPRRIPGHPAAGAPGVPGPGVPGAGAAAAGGPRPGVAPAADRWPSASSIWGCCSSAGPSSPRPSIRRTSIIRGWREGEISRAGRGLWGAASLLSSKIDSAIAARASGMSNAPSLPLEEKIVATLRHLPPASQAEVLDFAQFLSHGQQMAAGLRPYGRVELGCPRIFIIPCPRRSCGCSSHEALAGYPYFPLVPGRTLTSAPRHVICWVIR